MKSLFRETWGGVPKLEGKTLKVIFIIGNSFFTFFILHDINHV